MPTSTGLSDVLRQLADGQAPPKQSSSVAPATTSQHKAKSIKSTRTTKSKPKQASRPTPRKKPTTQRQPETKLKSSQRSVRSKSVKTKSKPMASPTRNTSQRRTSISSSGYMKKIGTPMMLGVGVLLLIPAIWGTCLLLGYNVWQSGRSDAKTVAGFMLICYPIGLMLVGYGAFLLSHSKKQNQAVNKSTSRPTPSPRSNPRKVRRLR